VFCAYNLFVIDKRLEYFDNAVKEELLFSF